MHIIRKTFLFILILSVGFCLLEYIPQTYKDNKKEIIYENGQISFYESKMIDTYLIASALYYDFDNSNFMNNQNSIAIETKDYFTKYKNHSFIQNLGKYLEVNEKNISFNVLVPLTTYVCWNSNEEIPEQMLKSNVFSSKKDFEEFYNNLRMFYNDTKAEQFFKNEEHWNKELITQINEMFATTSMDKYTKALENYVRNKDIYYKDQNVNYIILTSLFKPNGASFLQYQFDKDTNFICFTSSYSYSKDNSLFDPNQILENSIHEYCHMYVNAGVEKNMNLIEKMSSGKKKSDYACEMYENMEWNRIVDENIVRAVETRVYADVLGNEQDAYNQILEKEIIMGGFQHVYSVYKELSNYEKNRNKYLSIDDYMENLIYELFK